MSAAAGLVDRTAVVAPQRREAERFLPRLVRRPLAVVCLVYLGALVAIAVVAPLAMPWVANEQAGDLLNVRRGPSWSHLLGTDSLGRDELERVLVGTRVTLIAAVEAIAVAFAIGVPVGVVSGYLGGAVDRAVGWVVDLTLALPGLIIVLVVITVLPNNTFAAMATLGILAAPGLIRIVRSAVLPVREELYVAAARVSGLSRRYIMSRHILPRIAGPIIVQASLFAAGAILVQVALAYLGLLSALPAPSWGQMLGDGLANIVLQPWLIWPPGIVVTLTVLAFGLLGDVVRDVTSETWQAPARRPSGAEVQPPRGVRANSVAVDALLAVDRLDVVFPSPAGRVAVVEDVTFEIRAGETVGLVGESGCGKTVTAMSIIGLLPGQGEIAGGRILFEGRDLATLGERGLRAIRGREIGLISQDPMVSMNPAFRIGWQLVDCLRSVHAGLSRREARRRAIELLARVQLPEPDVVAQRYPHELSGGMAQRVSIACALAGNPKLLIADEPTTALDVTVQAEILELLRILQRDRGMAILLVTHDWGVVADMCERAVVMYAGQVVERAQIVPIFNEPLHPYTQALIAANPYHAAEAEMLAAIPGTVPKPGAWPRGCHFHPRCGYATVACSRGAIPVERPTKARETRCIHHAQLAAVERR